MNFSHRKIGTLILLLVSIFILSGCNLITQEATITAIEVENSTLEETYDIDTFDLSSIRIKVSFSDGKFQLIPITESMLSNEHKMLLSNIGEHEITLTYEGKTTTFSLTLSYSGLKAQLMTIYNLASTQGGFSGTYEEWLESVEGPQGEVGADGREVTFQIAAGFIQWQYVGDTLWVNLIDLQTITGADGTNGTDGVDGREVLFQVLGDYIQWQYSSDTTWTNLIDINTLTGVQGVGIAGTSINEFGELIITYTDNTVVNIGTIYKTYHVRFVGLNGYLVDSQMVVYGSDAVAPTAPIIEGYTFIGWSQTYTNITANTSINAIYQINTYTIEFETDGGLEIEPISNIEFNGTITLPIPIKEGYRFKGWYTGTTINDGQFSNVTKVTNNITLYARWESQLFTVKFLDMNDTILKEVQVVSEGSATAPIAPEINGYTFTGWTQPFINVTKDTITKATYSLNQYTISFNSNDGSLVDAITQDYETTVIEPIEPTKEGYTFVGWYTDSSLTTAYTFKTMEAEDITLYAKWEVKQYQINLISNGEILGTFFRNYGNLLNISTPTRIDYTFTGWCTDSSLTKNLDITMMPAYDLTLYAKWVYNESTGLQYQLINNDSEYAVCGYIGSDGVVKIPAYHNDKLVTAIADIGFGNNNMITSVIFEEGSQLYQIGSYAFFNSSVNSIILPDTVRIISSCAFYNATKLTSIEIPVGVTVIESMVFYGASELSNVTLPEGLTEIKTGAFQKTKLINMTIPNGVTHIGSAAFSDVSSLVSVILPSGLTTIEPSTFSFTTNLSSINIPYGVTSIGNRAFYWSGIRTISIPSSVTYIGDFAFSGASSLSKIITPDSVTVIGQSAFSSSGLTSVTLSKGLTEIPNECFANNKSLASITIPNNITRIGNGAFNNASSLSTITISTNLNSIGDYAFSGTRLNAVDLPATVTSIGDRVFNAIDGFVVIVLRSTTPPTLAGYLGMGYGGIYVPSTSVNAYKSAPNWNYYSANISSIPA